ncbi:MAG TPA: anhydro-N-acetylmuramic acid kinase [Nocardioidaceae bacterium]|nr:anhydro-N-acetylmuramic acid kinase [Nocardioidaceae bacterium]
MIVLGLISGTSVDGIDVAAAHLSLDADAVVLAPLGHLEVPYSTSLRADILAALPPAQTTMETVCRIDTGVGQEFAAAARRGVAELCDGRADLVVSHGQTLFHWVEDSAVRGTLQLGQPAWIAEATGLPVVADLRTRDVAAGGQGAPLASTLDVLLLAESGRPSAALNIGGIANLTVVRPGDEPRAFDTGPGNALVDAAVGWLTDGAESFDRDGLHAAKGQIDEKLLDVLLEEPYYALQPPKSTGKELFHGDYLRRACARAGAEPGDDVVTTVTALTARTVADACRAYAVEDLLVSGGGARNPTLMRMLTERLADVSVSDSAAAGVPSDAKEAYLFALLGFLGWHGVPATVPSCTGARHPSLLGTFVPGSRPMELPAAPQHPPTRLRISPTT